MTDSAESQPPEGRARNDIYVRSWRALLEVPTRLLSTLATEMETETDLSERIILSKSGMTALVDRLEHRGLLARVPDPTDRRAVRVAITDDGMHLFRVAAKAHLAGIERHFASHVSEDEARAILEIMERIRSAD